VCRIACLLALFTASLAAAPNLELYFIDVEGGKSVVMVSPSGQSMLFDVGWPAFNNRPASTERIVEAVQAAGLKRIDFLVISHFEAGMGNNNAYHREFLIDLAPWSGLELTTLRLIADASECRVFFRSESKQESSSSWLRALISVLTARVFHKVWPAECNLNLVNSKRTNRSPFQC
jgi:hypothetical protein